MPDELSLKLEEGRKLADALINHVTQDMHAAGATFVVKLQAAQYDGAEYLIIVAPKTAEDMVNGPIQ